MYLAFIQEFPIIFHGFMKIWFLKRKKYNIYYKYWQYDIVNKIFDHQVLEFLLDNYGAGLSNDDCYPFIEKLKPSTKIICQAP